MKNKFSNFQIIVVLFLLLAAEIIWLKPHHPEYIWHQLKGFQIFLGVVGSIGLMKFAKWIGKTFLYRKESYYHD